METEYYHPSLRDMLRYLRDHCNVAAEVSFHRRVDPELEITDAVRLVYRIYKKREEGKS